MSLLPKPKKPLDSLLVIDKERELKKLRGETDELIDEMGQSSEVKALGTVQKYVKEQEQEEEEQNQLDLHNLKNASKNKKTYQRYLIAILHRFVKLESIPKKYSLYVESNDEGIIMGITGTEFYGAFRVVGIPFYDINACKILAVRLGNTVGKLEGNFTETEGGILLASKQDMPLLKYQKGNHGRAR